MERVTLRALGLASLLFSSATFAGLTDLDDWSIKPNIGIDVGVKDQSFSGGFGREHFREHYPVTDIYFGAKFHPYVGMEVGYEHMYRSQMQQYYNAEVPILGFVPGVAEQHLSIAEVYAQGWNVNLLGFWPICPRTKTEIMGTIGIAWVKMYYNTAMLLQTDPATPLALWESDDRAMLRLGIGVRQMITKHFGSRLNLFWEDTSKLSASFPVPVGQGGANPPIVLSDSYTAKPKDNYSVMLGFFFQIT